MPKCDIFICPTVCLIISHKSSENQERHGQTDAYYNDKGDVNIFYHNDKQSIAYVAACC